MADEPPEHAPKGGDLDERLQAAQSARREKERTSEPDRGLGLAFRLSTELAAALVVSVAIGWGLDRWLGTGPWLMVVFIFVGFAAGLLNVQRAMKEFGDIAGGDS